MKRVMKAVKEISFYLVEKLIAVDPYFEEIDDCIGQNCFSHGHVFFAMLLLVYWYSFESIDESWTGGDEKATKILRCCYTSFSRTLFDYTVA